MNHRLKLLATILAGAISALASTSATGSLVGYTFEWGGSDGYTMSGYFTYDTSRLNRVTGIDKDEVVSIYFEGFLNGASIGANGEANTQNPFVFNFNNGVDNANADSEQFFLNSCSLCTQQWNSGGSGLGFATGSRASGLTLDGSSLLGRIDNPVPLIAERATLDENGVPTTGSSGTAPAPATLGLLAAGLVGLAWGRRKKRFVYV